MAAAAEELGCSKAYIFKVLKDNGLRLKDIIKSQNQEVGHYKPSSGGKTPNSEARNG